MRWFVIHAHRALRAHTFELQFSFKEQSRNNGAEPTTREGWFFTLRSSASQGSRVPGAAQHEVGRCRPGTVPVRGGPGSATHRFADARAAWHPGHVIARLASLSHDVKQPYATQRHGAAAHVLASALTRSEEHTSELQSLRHLVCRLL